MEGALVGQGFWPRIFVSKKIPMLWQAEAGECGLACLGMCLARYGGHFTLRQLRQQFGAAGRGANIQQLKNIACQLGAHARVCRIELEDLERCGPGLILHWDFNHFVVFVKKSFGRYLIHDPASGKRWLTSEQLSKHFTGIAMLIANRAIQALPKEQPIAILGMLNTRPALVQVLMTMSLSIVLQLCMLFSPLYLQTVVDDVVLRLDNNLLASLVMAFTLLLVFQSISQLLRDTIVLRFSALLNQQMSEDLFRHLITLPLRFFNARHIGDIQSRFNSLDYFRQLLSQSLAVSLVDGVLALATLAAMLLYSPGLSGLVVFMMVVSLSVVIGFSFFICDAQQHYVQQRAILDSHFIESVKAILTLKHNGWQGWRVQGWCDRVLGMVNADVTAQKRKMYMDAILRFLQGGEHILLVYFAANLVMDGHLTVGMLFAFMAYKGRFANALQGLVSVLIELRMLSLHRERVGDILLTAAGAEQHKYTPLGGEHLLEAKQLSLKLPSGPTALFSLSLKHKECLAIVGPSGCGKSTLLRTILGLEEGAGDICWSIPRQRLSAVLQEDSLLSGKLSENIAGFGVQVDQAWLQQVLLMAGLTNVLSQLPMGLETSIGEQGTPLSAGQTQRVLLARALYRKPQVLILDEATSHLDVAAETSIMASLKSLPVSILMVAHRPNCLAFADRYFCLQTFSESMHLEHLHDRHGHRP